MKLYKVLTYGCQMNVRESEEIEERLKGLGYDEAPSEAEADLIVVNTCSVRDTAERRILGKISELKHLKQGREVVLAVGGCLVAQPHVQEAPPRELAGVDILFANHRLDELTGRLGGSLPAAGSFRRGRVRAWVKIMEGCDNFCSYCVVPLVRGRERSRSRQEILSEVEKAVADGFREIVLLGQNVNSYGRDRSGQPEFAELLTAVGRVEGVTWVRFITSHPKDLSGAVLSAMAESPTICRHFHLPVQAGSDRILAAMNRGYRRHEYVARVDEIRRRFPGAALTTDLIVGFPGETEEEFVATLDLCRQVRFDRANAFIYSPRRGTPAASIPDPVTPEEKKLRLERLNHLQAEISREKNLELLGTEVMVLVDGPSPRRPDRLQARTETDKVVILTGPMELAGRLVAVRIVEAGPWSLRGEWLP